MMASIASRFYRSVFQDQSAFVLNVLARINTALDLLRRTYNRSTQWFNLLAINIGQLNRVIPYIGLMFNLSNLALRAVIAGLREKNNHLAKIAYIGLIAVLALSSIFIVINTGPMSIVWLTITAAFTRVVLDAMDILFHLPLFQRSKTRMDWQEITHPLQQQKRQILEQERLELLCKIALLCKMHNNTDLSQNLLIRTLPFYESILSELDHKISQLDTTQKTYENSLRQLGLSGTRLIGGLIVAALTAALFSLAITNPMLAFNLIIAIEVIECLVLGILFQQFYCQATIETQVSIIDRSTLEIDNEVVLDSYIKMQNILEKNKIQIENESPETMIALIDKAASTDILADAEEIEINDDIQRAKYRA